MIVSARPTLVSVVAGGAIVVAGEFLRLWGVAIAGSETRTTDRVGGTYLVTTGPFAHVRNPLYLGNIILYVGFGVMSMALFPWLPAFALVFFSWEYSMIVSLEEEHLESRFQADYLTYKRSVPRFFPSPRKFTGGEHAQPAIDWKRGMLSEKRSLQAILLLAAAIVVEWQLRA